MTATQLLPFLPAAFAVVLAPGAGNLLAMSHAAQAGWAAAVRALAGRMAAFALMVGLVALGLDAILGASEAAFRALKWAGIAYLVWLGARQWRGASRAATGAAPPAGALARREFLAAMGNPKAYLLFAAFLPQFVVGAEAVAPQIVALGAVYIGVEALAAMGWAAAGAGLGRAAVTPRARRRLDRLSGLTLIGAAGLLARTGH